MKNRIRFIQLLANSGSENGDQPKTPPDLSPTEYSWRDQAHLLQRPLSMNDKSSADRNEHANNFAKFAVLVYNSSILTRVKPS